jgi:hypothetical protein
MLNQQLRFGSHCIQSNIKSEICSKLLKQDLNHSFKKTKQGIEYSGLKFRTIRNQLSVETEPGQTTNTTLKNWKCLLNSMGYKHENFKGCVVNLKLQDETSIQKSTKNMCHRILPKHIHYLKEGDDICAREIIRRKSCFVKHH